MASHKYDNLFNILYVYMSRNLNKIKNVFIYVDNPNFSHLRHTNKIFVFNLFNQNLSVLNQSYIESFRLQETSGMFLKNLSVYILTRKP